MKKFILITVIFFFENAYSNINIVYVDVQRIIDSSDIGIFYKNEMQKIQNKSNSKIEKKELSIKKLQSDINSQKNILKKDELDNKIIELNKLLKNYQSDRKNLRQEFVKQKNVFTEKILQILNPILTRYAEKNNISCGIMYRTDLFKSSGGYNSAMRHREEEELRKRLGEDYKIHHLKIPFYRYRMHDSNKTKQPEYETWKI